MTELRAHPAFVALPPAHLVFPTSASELRLFRQDSRQWWACHAGRISTSACASCLGVYEERTASQLGVPPSLRGRGKALDAYSRLASPVLDDYSQLHASTWMGSEDWEEAASEAEEAAAAEAAWRPRKLESAAATASSKASSRASSFLCEYRPTGKQSTVPSGRDGRSYHSVGQIRMAWGSVQEATSILAALNYFAGLNATVEEAGLQPLEALDADDLSALPHGLPPIGASPDAIVRWPDGAIEPFEVKNHAPFGNNYRARSDPNAPPFEIRDPGPYDEIAIWHIPQLYLHMLCLGSRCNSAVFMSCSATRGAHIMRLRRDERLMTLMLRFVAHFAADFGRAGCQPPEPDYFWGVPEYDSLLKGLARAAAEDVETVARIPDSEVQRGREARFFFS